MECRAVRGIAALVLSAALACGSERAQLVVANNADPASLDPQVATDAPAGRVLNALFCGLTRLDPATLELLPALAESWESGDGFRWWRFQLRPGLRWSDGSPLTAQDLEQSWRRLTDPATGAGYGGWLDDLVELSARGPELVARFSQPMPAFAEMCSYHALAPVPPGLRRGTQAPGTVSDGPFRLVERRIRFGVRLEPNPFYWDAASVRLESLEFRTVESQFTALNLFLTGEADFVPEVPSLAVTALLERERHRPGLRPEFRPSPFLATYFYRLNVQRPPLDDPRVRRALNLAVDRDQIAATLGGGQPAAASFVPPWIPGYRPPELEPRFDPAAARASLAEAGFPGGAGFPELELLFNSAEIHRDVAEAIQAQWRQHLGIRTRLLNQEWKVFLDAQRGLDYQLSRSSWIADYRHPATFLEIFRRGSPNNRTGWADGRYEALLDRARLEPDRTAQLSLYRRAEELLLRDGPVLPLFFYANQELVSGRVRGFHRNVLGWVDWGRLRMAAEPEAEVPE
ncbi:MAG: peptide ABC transporter substrate-binding protein [Planctomycetes bacterium]|nr:peptide ABC transporter substrate-binding protein [Planctomycetota bacterium]